MQGGPVKVTQWLIHYGLEEIQWKLYFENSVA